MRLIHVAREASTTAHVTATLAQTAVFWTVFLLLLPTLVVQGERTLGLPPLGFPHAHWIGIGLFVLGSGLGLTTGLVMAVVGRGTPLPLATARTLVQWGPYRLIRNPMALAGITQGVAVGLWRDSVAIVLYALAGAVVWHIVARPPEERDLEARFGGPYRAYRDQVPLWVHTRSRVAGRTVALCLFAIGAMTSILAASDSWPLVYQTLPATSAACLLGFAWWRSASITSAAGRSA